MGFNSADNGFVGFNQHRIPRDHMLMKNAQVGTPKSFKQHNDRKVSGLRT